MEISVVRKDALRVQLAAVRKAIVDASRIQEKEQIKEVSSLPSRLPTRSSFDRLPRQSVEIVTAYFSDKPDQAIIVCRLDVNGNAKVRLRFALAREG